MILEQGLKQHRIENQRHRVVLNILYTEARLGYAIYTALKPLDLTQQQFNILRILRGQKGMPVSIGSIRDRMIDKMSNTTRLLDKLLQKRLISRIECPLDRRRAEITITEAGLAMVSAATQAVNMTTTNMIAHINDQEISKLNDLLDHLNDSNLTSSISNYHSLL